MQMSPHGTAIHLVCRIAVAVLSVALVVGSGIPQVHGDEWWIRLFDFPRIQIAVSLGLTLVGYTALRWFGRLRPWEYVLGAFVGVALLWQLVVLAPYGALHPKEMSDSCGNQTANRISLLVYNVLSDNREVAALRSLVRDVEPDIILLSEPTQWWLDQLDGLEAQYPYTHFQPQDNEYGKLLYSRLELAQPEIRFLIEPDIPSIRAKVRLPSGIFVTLIGLHPRPPGLEEEGAAQDDGEREDTDVRDAELLSIAREVKELGDVPVIVTGDFNEVPWPRTIDRFQRIGGLLDPRVGRGFANTFDATHPLLRYPLDHLFASRHFRLVEIRRLPDIGSDHFPLLVTLDYDPERAAAQHDPEPDPGDQTKAEHVIDRGKTRD